MTIPIFGGIPVLLARFHARRILMENVYIYDVRHIARTRYLSFRGEHKAREREKDILFGDQSARSHVEAVEGTAALSNSPSTARHVEWSRPDFAKYGITNTHVRARVQAVVI